MKNTKKKQAQAGQKAANNGGFSIEEEPISKPEENNNPADINVSITMVLFIILNI